MLLLLLAACGCPDFDQTAIVDRTGTLTDEQLTAYRTHLDWFSEVTGLDGACVNEVRIHDDLESHGEAIGGLYSGYARLIRMDIDAPLSSFTHELCHAADDALGDLSLAHPDLFDLESVEVGKLYSDDAERTREAFARACVSATADLRIARGLADTCGEPLDTATHDFLRAEVWRNYQDPPMELAFADVETGQPWQLADLLGDVIVLEIAGTARTIALLVAGWPEPAMRGSPGDEGHRLHLLHIDPWTQTLVSATDLRQRTYDQASVLHGDDAAWVLLNDPAAGTRALRVPVEGGIDRHPFPELLTLPYDGGAVVGDTAWLLSASLPDGPVAVMGIDLPTLQVDDAPAMVLDQGGSPYWRLVPTGGGPGVALWNPDASITVVALADGAATPVGPEIPLALRADGSSIARAYFRHPDGAYTADLLQASADGVHVRIDPETCDTAWTDRTLPVQVGDTAWLVEGDGWSASTLTLRELPL